MKKILHMTPPEVSNGVYQYIFNHMPMMCQKGYEFSFLTKAAEDLKQTKEYEKYHFPIYQLTNTQRDGREGFIKEIKKILYEGFDVIHLHTSSWRGFLIEEIAMELGIPKVIVHSHSSGIDFSDTAERERILKDLIYYKDQFSMKYATDVCACSKVAADWLFNERIPRNNIRIMPNAVDIKRYRFCSTVREEMRRKLGVSKRIVIGNVGRISYTKNQEFLIKAFTRAYQANRDLFMIIIGQGENTATMQTLIQKLGMEHHIQCLGWCENVQDYLQAMDAFCLPSKFEGFPISVVEAQAAGLQCLVSDTVTKEVDLTGLVTFIPLEEGVWADIMSELKNDKIRRCWDEYFESAGYSIEASCGRLESLYGCCS